MVVLPPRPPGLFSLYGCSFQIQSTHLRLGRRGQPQTRSARLASAGLSAGFPMATPGGLRASNLQRFGRKWNIWGSSHIGRPYSSHSRRNSSRRAWLDARKLESLRCLRLKRVGVPAAYPSPQARRGFETCTHSGSDLGAAALALGAASPAQILTQDPVSFQGVRSVWYPLMRRDSRGRRWECKASGVTWGWYSCIVRGH